MKISKLEAMHFFELSCFIDLQEGKFIPSMKFAKLMTRTKPIKYPNINLSADDYLHMEANPERYLRPPVMNPAYVYFLQLCKQA